MLLYKEINAIHHFQFTTAYECSSTFMRLAEFFESPIPSVRGTFFTVESFMDAYALKYGKMSYFDDWACFNVPGDAARRFFKKFREDLTYKERAFLLGNLRRSLESDRKFYIIGTHNQKMKNGECLSHELSHAFYHLDDAYRETMEMLLDQIDPETRSSLISVLKKDGYIESVLDDELIAYLATSTWQYLKESFIGSRLKHVKKIRGQMRKVFNQKLEAHQALA